MVTGHCHPAAVDLVRVGASLRAIRVARRERIEDVAARSGLSASGLSRIERGVADGTPVAGYARVAATLGASLDLWVRWRGAELDTLINATHSGLHEGIARRFGALPAWQASPEVSYSIYGERGVIDWLAWHPASRSLLVVEIKTVLVDAQAVLAQIDRYGRLAPRIARDRGWEPATVSVWLIFADSSRNRRGIAAHAALFGTVFAVDGQAMRAWLRHPAGSVRALSFLSNCHGATPRPKRVRPARAAPVPPRTNPRAEGSRGGTDPG